MAPALLHSSSTNVSSDIGIGTRAIITQTDIVLSWLPARLLKSHTQDSEALAGQPASQLLCEHLQSEVSMPSLLQRRTFPST